MLIGDASKLCDDSVEAKGPEKICTYKFVYGGLFLTHESRTGRGSCPSLDRMLCNIETI